MTVDADQWLLVWAWRLRGTRQVPPPVPGLDWVPWPEARSADEVVVPPVPVQLAESGEKWQLVPGASLPAAVYLGEYAVIRVARRDTDAAALAAEAALLRRCRRYAPPLPTLLDSGPGWVMTRRSLGSHPTQIGPWVAELGAFCRSFHASPDTLSLSVCAPVDWVSLEAVVGGDVVRQLRGPAIDDSHGVRRIGPSHGDLHTENILVDEDGHLGAVLDLELAALAPAERDVIRWVAMTHHHLGPEIAPLAVQALCPDGVDPGVLYTEYCRELGRAAQSALRRPEPGPYLRTVAYLARALAEDPGLAERSVTAPVERSRV